MLQPNPTCVMKSMVTTKVHTYVHITGHCALLVCDDGGGGKVSTEHERTSAVQSDLSVYIFSDASCPFR